MLFPKLRQDLSDPSKPVSEACIFAPKLKKPEAKALALALFPETATRQEAYIQYYHAIKRLKEKFWQQRAEMVPRSPSKYLFYHN